MNVTLLHKTVVSQVMLPNDIKEKQFFIPNISVAVDSVLHNSVLWSS